MRRRNAMSFRSMPRLSPDTMYCKLIWNVEIHTTGSTPQVRVFRANSAFRPDTGGFVNQPVGYDQYAAMYQKYVVQACAIKVTATNLSTIPLRILCWPSFSTSDPPTDDVSGQPYTKRMNLASVEGGPASRVLTNFLRTKKMYGKGIEDTIYAANVDQSPSQEWFWHVKMSSLDFTAAISATMTYELTYYIKFYKRTMIKDVESALVLPLLAAPSMKVEKRKYR